MLVDTGSLLSISEANARGVSRLAGEAESGHDTVLLRNSKPIAAVVGMERMARLQELEDLEDDLRLMALTLARTVTDSGNRTSFDKVLAHFGLERDDLVSPDQEDWGRTVPEISFIDAAIEDLESLDGSALRLVLGKLRILETNAEAGQPLGRRRTGDLTNYRKLVVGDRDYRIVYRVDTDGGVCVIWVIAARAGTVAW
jgi:mRNA-degrading endonuclease RelE of RelBE toxin-antitoxin system